MKDFIKTTPKEENINVVKIDAFIEKLNDLADSGVFSANTTLDNIPYLYPKEFDVAKSKAFDAGYELRATEDNYNSTTYILKHI